MSRGAPPSPAMASSLATWANQLYEYLLAETRVGTANDPLPVLLPHRQGGLNERAGQAGVVMYDPILKSIVYSEDGVWRPISMNFSAFLAEQEIFRLYGDTVSVVQAAETEMKFGNHLDLDTADGFATIWQLGSEVGLENEVYVPAGTNLIDSISSTSASDTAKDVEISYSVSDGGTGANENFTKGSQIVTLNGQTRVALTTPCARVNRARAAGSVNLLGDVYVYENTALTGGKPTDITKAHISIKGSTGENQSFKAALTVHSNEYLLLTGTSYSVRRGVGISTAVDFRMQSRKVGGVFRPVTGSHTATNTFTTMVHPLNPYLIVPPNSDVRQVAATSANNALVSSTLQGIYARIVS